MAFTPASTHSLAAFVLVLLAVIAAFWVATYRAAVAAEGGAAARTWLLRVGGGTVAWLGLLAALVASGVLEAHPVPLLFLFLGGSNVVALVMALSRVGGMLAAHTTFFGLVGFQAFRLPLELILHDWGKGGTIPMTMTWDGANWDVLSGLVALLAAPFADKQRWAAWLANVVGFVLLLNVGRVAVMSSPVPFGWQLEQPLQLAFHLPYALIVPVCVSGALAGHVILTRRLLGGYA